MRKDETLFHVDGDNSNIRLANLRISFDRKRPNLFRSLKENIEAHEARRREKEEWERLPPEEKDRRSREMLAQIRGMTRYQPGTDPDGGNSSRS
jgi:hypothetical protein